MTEMTPEPATSSRRDDAVATVATLVEQARICMLTTTTSEGRHVSRPMAVQEVAFDGDLWFFCYDDSEKADQVRSQPPVNVAFSDLKHSAWTSIAGRASVVHDHDKAAELWSPALEVWFDDGLETPGLALLKVETESAEYWDAPDSKVNRLVGGLRVVVSGDPDRFPAGNETVRLDQR